jgi:arginyl-tRNA synthetase
MNIFKSLEKDFKKVFNELGYNEENANLTFSNRPELCDFQCNSAFVIAKIEKKSPIEIANLIAQKLKSENYTVSVANPGFINLTLTDVYFSKILKELFNDERVGIEKHKAKKVVLDYGGPNVAKALHVGHLRAAIIGETLKRLALFMGDEVIGDVHLGDWGLQMGLTIANIIEKYNCEYYFSGKGAKPELTLEELNTLYPEAAARAKEDEEFKKRAQELTVKLQNKEKAYYQLWKDIRAISIKAIKENYKKLNVDFDLWYGESDAQPYIQKTFDILNKKKLIEKSEGAEIVNVVRETDNSPMPPVIVRSSTDAVLYATTDIATILSRVTEFNPDEIWYVTDNRQSMHFEQVFRVCRLAEIVKKDVELLHLPFGTINGTDGKPFKTRDGGTMRLADLIDLITNTSEEKLKESEKAFDLSEKARKELALKIGVSAIKFGDMINYREKDYVFDIPKFCSFEGKTGPYMLYSIVRINSILKKAGEFTPNFKISLPVEKEIIINLLKFINDVKQSYSDKAPNIMVQSAFNLAASFSTLYNQTKILTEKDIKKKNSLLTLLTVVKNALSIFSNILAIDIPNKM